MGAADYLTVCPPRQYFTLMPDPMKEETRPFSRKLFVILIVGYALAS